MKSVDFPEKYTERMKELLGDEYDSFIDSYQASPHSGLRANTLKISIEQLKSLMSLTGECVNWCDQGIYLNDNVNERPSKSVFYNAGLFYIQEPSAMSPGSVINIEQGDKVLDLCAAPGGKSTQIAARLGGSGLLVSNDASASRCGALVKNIELSGVTNAIITNERPEKLSGRLGAFFDKVIIDAPCSGEGMFRKDRDAVKSWDIYKSGKCRAMQKSILYHGARMLKPGGELVYSTCTFEPEENEAVIAEFIQSNKNYSIVPIDHARFGFERGRPELTGAARIWPHRQKGEGHFIAMLKRDINDDSDTVINSVRGQKADAAAISLFDEFCEKNLNIRIDGSFALNGVSLYRVPPEAPDLSGIRTVRSGWYLGDIKTKRFEPSQAMAMGLKMSDTKFTINYVRTDENLYRYLRGESFEGGECEHDGWNLVCVEGYPLGWAKVSDMRLKNKYFKGWIT